MITFLKDTFKTYHIQYYIGHQYDPKYYVHARLLVQLMTNNSHTYPTRKSFHEAMELHYGVVFSGKQNLIGHTNLLKFDIKGLHGQFVEKDTLLLDSVKLSLDAIIQPHFDHHIFDEEVYSMLQQLYAIKENKRGYASYRFKHTLDASKTRGMSLEEQVEVLKSITLQDVIAYYEQIVSKAEKIVVGTGPFSNEDIIALEKLFKPFTNGSISLTYDPIEYKTLETVKEFIPMNQKMIYQAYYIGILPQDRLYYATLIYNEVLGSSADSRLFREIREKRGLCYQVYAGYNPFDTTLTIYAGIDIAKENQTLQALDEVVESMHVIEDEELEFAKKSLIHQVTSMLDNQNYPLDALTRKHFYHYDLDHQTRLLKIESISQNDLKEVHKLVKKMYTYMLSGEEHA